jgi:Domain of unknown function (DUF4178)
MKIQIRDVLSLSGRDYLVEGLATIEVAGKTSIFARAVDGRDVVWVESAAADRLLVLRQIDDLDLAAPPPESISFHDVPYVLRLSGRARLALSGLAPERTTGPAQIWYYRTAGDLHLQIEEQDGRLFMLAGQTVHRGMIDLLPGH